MRIIGEVIRPKPLIYTVHVYDFLLFVVLAFVNRRLAMD
jgi:hypothetical protein